MARFAVMCANFAASKATMEAKKRLPAARQPTQIPFPAPKLPSKEGTKRLLGAVARHLDADKYSLQYPIRKRTSRQPPTDARRTRTAQRAFSALHAAQKTEQAPPKTTLMAQLEA